MSALIVVMQVPVSAASGRMELGDSDTATTITSTVTGDPMLDEVVVILGEATPRRLLVDWANGQGAWVRQLTAETILSRRAPTSDLLDSVYEVPQREGIRRRYAERPKLQVQGAETIKDKTLELASLSNSQSFNALASDQRLEFDPSVTILFGQNGRQGEAIRLLVLMTTSRESVVK